MLLTTPDNPPVFRREQVLYVGCISDRSVTGYAVGLFVELIQYALSEQHPEMVLLISYKINTSIVNREYLPIRFYLHFQLRCQNNPIMSSK